MFSSTSSDLSALQVVDFNKHDAVYSIFHQDPLM